MVTGPGTGVIEEFPGQLAGCPGDRCHRGVPGSAGRLADLA
jgi:hypothetical protein